MDAEIDEAVLNGPRVVDRLDVSSAVSRAMSDVERVAGDRVPGVGTLLEAPDQAGGYAGNINLAKLDSPQSIDQALNAASEVGGGFMDNRRGAISHAETERLAGEMGMTADDLRAQRKERFYAIGREGLA